MLCLRSYHFNCWDELLNHFPFWISLPVSRIHTWSIFSHIYFKFTLHWCYRWQEKKCTKNVWTHSEKEYVWNRCLQRRIPRQNIITAEHKQHLYGNLLPGFKVVTTDRDMQAISVNNSSTTELVLMGFYDEFMFRLSKMLVTISGIADGISGELIWSNKASGPDANLDFVAHATSLCTLDQKVPTK